jgi:hypothetical protein
MLFFRSEETIDEWCRANGHPRRPSVRMDQLWHLATTWYGNRLSPDARRPKPAEMRGIFAAIGLEGDFWDPLADEFG